MNAATLRKLKIAVVDDNNDDRVLVRANLRAKSGQSYEFVEFSTSEKALDYLKENFDDLPDCMVLDIHMPMMGGIDLLERCHEIWGRVILPVVVLTGSSDSEEGDMEQATRALSLGAQDYVSKNNIVEVMLPRVVHNAMERFRLLRERRLQEEQYRLATEASNLGTWGYIPKTGRFHCSARCRELTRLAANDDEVTLDHFLAAVHEDDKEEVRAHIENTLVNPAPSYYRFDYRIKTAEGKYRWVNTRGRTLVMADGTLQLNGTIQDITERKSSDVRRQEELEILEAVYRVGNAFQRNTQLKIPVQLATEEATRLSGAQFGAFFYNVENDEGGEYMLYTVAGVPADHFSQFPMPRNTAVFAPTFGGEGALRLDDVTKDPRYGHNTPHKGMPEGHLPVRSYLAVPVMSGDEVLGGLFFGHEEVGVFDERSERIVMAIASQAAIGIQNNTLFRKTQESQVRLKQIVNSLPQLAWIADARGDLTWYNDRWYDYTGTGFEEMKGMGWQKVHHPDHVQRVTERYKAHIASGENWEDIFPIRSKGGEYRWFLSRAYPYKNDQGEIMRWFGSNTDITEQLEQEQFTRSIMDSTPDCLKVVDLNGTILTINDSGCQLLELDDANQILNHCWTEIMPEEAAKQVRKGLQQAAQGKTTRFEAACPTYRKNDRWWEVVITPIQNPHKKVTQALAISRDITERKAIERKLHDTLEQEQMAREKAEAANIAKSEFLANMSHEIRTPMNAVIGLSNIIARSQPLTAKQKEYIHTLQLSADSLLGLINDLLDIAKIEARGVELEEIAFDMRQLLADMASVMAVRAKEKGLEFRLVDHCPPGVVFLGDLTRIKQIFLNLCSNAIKFTRQGSVTVTAHCESTAAGYEMVTITVSDTGIGIAPGKIGDIFDKFVQADSSINRQFGGTGLGLAICKTLAEAMGGSIRVKSEQDKGSVFIVSLPLKVGSSSDIVPQERNEYDAPDAQAMRPKILLVEDYPANVLVATSFLDQFGYDYDVASNGQEAVERVTVENDYIAVLMDVQMPGMNGFDATRLIREHERDKGKPAMPIIGMTAHALAGDRERCIESGMDGYIAKPFNPDELQEILKSYEAAA